MKKLLAILGTIGMTATAGTAVVACGNNDKDKLEEKEPVPVEVETLQADIGQSVKLTIPNKVEFSKVTVECKNDEDETLIIERHEENEEEPFFSVTATVEGIYEISVQAEGYKDRIINLEITNPAFTSVDASIDKQQLKIGETATVIINNYQLLTNVEVENINDDVVKINKFTDGRLTITALKEGNATVKITADEANPATFNLTVSPQIEIKASIDKSDLNVGDTATITVENYAELEDLKIESSDSKIVEVGELEGNKVQVEALTEGIATIKISASNTNLTQSLTVNVTEPTYEINASIDNQKLKVGDSATVTVENFAQLTNLKIGSSNSGVVKVGEFKDGKATVTAVKSGDATVKVTADNASEKTFDINVDTVGNIVVKGMDSVNWIAKGRSGEQRYDIENYENLQNVQVLANDELLDVVDNKGDLHLTGLKQGETTLTITASGMHDLKVTFFVLDNWVNFEDVVSDTQVFVNDDSIDTIYRAIKDLNPAIAPDTKFFNEKGDRENEYVIWTNNYAGKLHFNYVVRKDISGIVIDDVEIKDRMDEVKAKINQAITDIVGVGVKEDEDYTVEGNTANAKEYITVTAKETSYKVQGQFRVYVNKFDISKLSLSINPADLADVTKNVAPKVADLIRQSITEPIEDIDLGTDFEIKPNLPQATDIQSWTVVAVDNSQYIRGSFDLVVQTNLADIQFNLKGLIGLTDDEANAKINSKINEFAPGVTSADWTTKVDTRSNFEMMTVSASENSKYLFGSFEVARKISMNNWGQRIDVQGLSAAEVENKIKKTVNEIPGVNPEINNDWTIDKDWNGDDLVYSVKSVEGSNIFSGEFTLTINDAKENINQWLTPEMLNLGAVKNETEAMEMAQNVIDGISELKGKVLLSEANDGKIHVQANDEFLIGEADFIYTIVPDPIDINGLLEGKLDLGEVENHQAAKTKAKSVLIQIHELAGKVNLNKVRNENKIRVTVKPEAKESLTGEAYFTYTIKEVKPAPKDISKILKGVPKYLGELETDQDALIKTYEIINGFDELKDKVIFDLDKENKYVIVIANDESLIGTSTFGYRIKDVTPAPDDINDILENIGKDLGELPDHDAAWNQVVEIVNSFPQLDNGKVKIQQYYETNEVVVSAKDSSLVGEVVFTYSLPVIIDINDVLEGIDKNLGELSSHDSAWTKVVNIVNRFHQLNNGKVKIEQNYETNEIIVSAKDSSLVGEVVFTYSVKAVVNDINNILEGVDKNLGELPNHEAAWNQVSEIVKSFPELNDGKVMIQQNYETNEIIVSAKDSSLVGEVVFTYTIAKSNNLNDIEIADWNTGITKLTRDVEVSELWAATVKYVNDQMNYHGIDSGKYLIENLDQIEIGDWINQTITINVIGITPSVTGQTSFKLIFAQMDDIELDMDHNVNMDYWDTTSIQIKNFDKFQGAWIKSMDNYFLDARLDWTGTLTIKSHSHRGDSTIHIEALNNRGEWIVQILTVHIS